MLLKLENLPECMRTDIAIVAPQDMHPEPDHHLAMRLQKEAKNPILLRMRNVPHLRLLIPPLDMQRALSELQPVLDEDDFDHLSVNYDSKDHHESYTAKAFVNLIPNSIGLWIPGERDIAALQYPEYQPRAKDIVGERKLLAKDMEFYPTDLWHRLPYMMEYITTHICKKMYRSHIGRLSPNSHIDFHNHRLLNWETESYLNDEAIVHIPLITHPSTKMCVRYPDGNIDVQHYGPGEAWLFNSWMDHGVDNTECPIARVHLTMWCNIEDPLLTALISKSLDATPWVAMTLLNP